MTGAMVTNFGRVLKADASEVAPLKHGCGLKWNFTILNEYNKVVTHAILESDSSEYKRQLLQQTRDRYEAAQQPLPEDIWVDKDCCSGHLRTEYQKQNYPTVTEMLWHILNPAIRIHLDIFHWMHRLHKGLHSRQHMMAAAFFQALSRACFIVHKGDWDELIHAYCVVFKVGIEEAIKNIPTREVVIFCRRGVPPPGMLERRLQEVFKLFSLAHYQGIPLFNARMYEIWAQALIHVRNGCLSDPEGDRICMYRLVKHVNYRSHPGILLPVWATCRGSSQVEAIHPGLHATFNSTIVGQELGHCCITDYFFNHNNNRDKDAGNAHAQITNLSLLRTSQECYEKAFEERDPQYNVYSFANMQAERKEVFGLRYAHSLIDERAQKAVEALQNSESNSSDDNLNCRKSGSQDVESGEPDTEQMRQEDDPPELAWEIDICEAHLNSILPDGTVDDPFEKAPKLLTGGMYAPVAPDHTREMKAAILEIGLEKKWDPKTTWIAYSMFYTQEKAKDVSYFAVFPNQRAFNHEIFP